MTFPAAIPEPRALPVIRHLHHIDMDAPVQSMMALAQKHGPLFRLSFPTGSMVMLGSHALVDDVCDGPASTLARARAGGRAAGKRGTHPRVR